MDYKNNTPNYKTKNVNNFSNFVQNIDKESEELDDLKRSMNKNHDDTQKYVKNSKFKFNKVTRKMDDISLDEIDDKIKALKESLEVGMNNRVNAIRRSIEDYNLIHSPFEKRGYASGVDIFKNSKNTEEAITSIEKEISKWETTTSELSEENVNDIIKGLKDLLLSIGK